MPLPEGIGDFILFDRKVVDAFNALDERTRFSKGLYAWAGFRQTSIPYTPHERHAGSSSFNFWKLRSEEHTSELQSLMRISYAVFCLKKKKTQSNDRLHTPTPS